MALIRPGGLVGQISGRLGGDVFSHNRYGQYVRAGSNPVTGTTSYALAAKARMTQASQGWQSLTAAVKLAWNAWASTNPTINRLGESIHLTGHAAYVASFCRASAAEIGVLTNPPIAAAPAPLATLSLTGDIGAGDVSAVYTATPLGANDHLWIEACVLDSNGINFVQNYLRHIGTSGAAQASPYVFEARVTARFGTLQVGQILVAEISVINDVTKQRSAPLRAQVAVTTT